MPWRRVWQIRRALQRGARRWHAEPVDVTVQRVSFGTFVRPGSETADGRARVEVVLGYVVRPPAGLLLLDTGIGQHPEVEAHYRPARRSLGAALAGAGADLDDVTLV